MNYTKGKWNKEGNKIKVLGRGTIAICPSPTNDEGVLEFVANALLIAAAPELYQVCYDLLAVLIDNGFTHCRAVEITRKALAKAEGK